MPQSILDKFKTTFRSPQVQVGNLDRFKGAFTPKETSVQDTLPTRPEIEQAVNGMAADVLVNEQIKEISRLSQEGNFTSPQIQETERDETGQLKPRSRTVNPVIQSAVQTAVEPFLKLQEGGKNLEKGNYAEGAIDILKAGVEGVITPVTVPISAGIQALKEVGLSPVAEGIERTFNLPFQAISMGSEAIYQGLKSLGIETKLSDEILDKKGNELLTEVGGLVALGALHSKGKSYVESQVPIPVITDKGVRFKDTSGKFIKKEEAKAKVDEIKSGIKTDVQIDRGVLDKIFELRDIRKEAKTPSDKRYYTTQIKKEIEGLRAKGFDAFYENGKLTINGQRIPKPREGTKKTDINDVEIKYEEAKQPFEKLTAFEQDKQTAIAEYFQSKKDLPYRLQQKLPKGFGDKSVQKGLEDIKKDGGREQSKEAQIVRDFVKDIEKELNDIGFIEFDNGMRISREQVFEEVDALVERRGIKNESGNADFPFGANALAKRGKSEIPTKLEANAEPIKASSIISNLSKELNVPIRIGKFRNKAVGIYKTQPEVVRLKEANDLATASHEVAHHIDKKVFTDFFKNEKNKKDLVKELKNLDYDKDKKRMGEGFAEFVRHYLTRDDAKEVAPKFYDYFTKNFLPKNAELGKTLGKAQASITQWREQGSLSRVIIQIDFEGKKSQLPIKEKLTDLKVKIQSKATNRLAPIEYAVGKIVGDTKLRPSENPAELAMSVSKTSSAKANDFIYNGAFDFAGNQVGKSFQEVVKPISSKALNEFNVPEYQGALAYAYAKHGKSLHERGVNPGISLEDANYVLKNYSKPQYEQFSKDFTEWSNHLINYLVDAGGLTKEAATRMREVNPFYIPLKRSFEESFSSPRGKGFADLPQPIKRIKGSGRDIVNPLESMIAMTEQIISVADKARVARSLANLTDKFPGAGKWIEKVPAPISAKMFELESIRKQIEKAGGDLSKADTESLISLFSQGQSYYGKDNIVSIYRDGKREFFQLNPMLYDAMKGLDKITLPWFVDVVFGKATRAVRLGATGIRAGFSLITNPIRDAQTFALQSEHAGVRPDKIARAIIEEARGKSLYAKEFRRGGGEMSQPLGLDRKMLQSSVQKLLANDIKSKSLNVAKHPIETLRKLMSFPEAGTRLAEFEAVMKKYEPKFENARSKGDLVELKKLQEDAMVEASNAASEVTVNFKRMGSYAEVLNQIIPFFNPAIQGLSVMGRTIYKHPLRSGLRVTALLTAPTLALWNLNKDEDWYKNLPDWQRYAFWNFKIGDEIVRLPKPFEWGYIFAGIPEGIANAVYNNQPKEISRALKEAGEGILPDVIPALFKPGVEVYFNWDLFRERPIVSKTQEGLLPAQQFTPYTSEVAKEVGGILNVSPLALDHLLSGYTGGLARDIVNGLPKEYKESADLPVVGRLFTRESALGFGGKQVSEFYDVYEKAESVYRTIKNAEKNNTEPPDLTEEQIKYLNNIQLTRKIAQNLSDLRKMQRQLQGVNLDKDVKKLMLKSINQSASEITGRFMEMLGEQK